jgi:hypothetical protein
MTLVAFEHVKLKVGAGPPPPVCAVVRVGKDIEDLDPGDAVYLDLRLDRQHCATPSVLIVDLTRSIARLKW